MNHAMRFRESPSNTSGLDLWLLERVVAGWHPRAIVAASDGAVSLRTAYRWRASVLRVESVAIGCHEALFAIRRNQPPIRVGPWKALRG